MSRRFTAGLRSIAGARSALLAVLVLNAVVLPCAMAVGLDDRNCLHAEPVGQHAMAGHRDMAGHHDMAGRHGGDDQDKHAAHSCADTQCCVVDAASVDSRFGQQKVRDAGDWDAAPVAHPAVLTACPVSRTERIERPPVKPGASPPRHKLFCVYLD